MRYVLFILVTLVTSVLANICSNNGVRRSIFVCHNASLNDLTEIPRYTYRIQFINSDIKNIPANSFVQFYELKSLSLVSCSIDNIESFAFNGLPNLKSLNLSRNALKRIRENVFYGLKSLEKVDLTNNMIESIDDGSFANVSNIGLLDLRYNNLTQIDVAILRPLTTASTLDLRFNKLRCISLEVFNETRLKWIYIGDNPWDKKCWADLTWCLYEKGIYYGKNLAYDTLTEDRLAWNISNHNLLSEEQAKEEADIVKEAEGWKKFYESIVQEIADERQRWEDLEMGTKTYEEILSNENTEKNTETGLVHYGRKIVQWIISVYQIFRISLTSSDIN